MNNIMEIFRPHVAKATRKPAQSVQGCKKFLVIESPSIIKEDNVILPAGEHQLPFIHGTVNVSGPDNAFSSAVDDCASRDAVIISNIHGTGVLNLRNVILMASKISSECKLIVNVENSQIISEGLVLENVTLNVSNSSLVSYPCNRVGFLLNDSVLNAKNTNFTLFTWLNDFTFIDAQRSAVNVVDSEFVVVGSIPSREVHILLINAVGGNHEFVNNKAFIIAGSGSVQLYNLTDTLVTINGLEVESTISNLITPVTNNSAISLDNVVVNGQPVVAPVDASRNGLVTSRLGFPHSVAPVTVIHNTSSQTPQVAQLGYAPPQVQNGLNGTQTVNGAYQNGQAYTNGAQAQNGLNSVQTVNGNGQVKNGAQVYTNGAYQNGQAHQNGLNGAQNGQAYTNGAQIQNGQTYTNGQVKNGQAYTNGVQAQNGLNTVQTVNGNIPQNGQAYINGAQTQNGLNGAQTQNGTYQNGQAVNGNGVRPQPFVAPQTLPARGEEPKKNAEYYARIAREYRERKEKKKKDCSSSYSFHRKH
ncbi:hypothetical protein BQ9231_00544 [Cedratvirus lausannensis]|uniref:Uncharacterized protein n=1 Tax=Cedratvirus lausannensis TaxID=2023205 RepID=A0A285PYV9_9VIRU|nr:hypothetical protein BQ9231_00544 [Cedratvirus lausannensis]